MEIYRNLHLTLICENFPLHSTQCRQDGYAQVSGKVATTRQLFLPRFMTS